MVAGINQRCRLALGTLERAVNRAVHHGCAQLYVLGDVFDTTRPEPQVMTEVQRILHRPRLDVIIVEGNHDMVSTAPGDHSLGPLSPNCHIIDQPLFWEEPAGPQVLAVPFEPGSASEWLPKRVKALLEGQAAPGGRRMLVTHVGISTNDTVPWLKSALDQIPASLLGTLCAEHHIDIVLAGNWHTHWIYNLATPRFSKAVQVGTLCPTGWDNPGLEGYGTMPIWDVSTGALTVEVIPGPRFLNIVADQLTAPQAKVEAPGCSLFVRARSDQSRMGLCQDLLQKMKDSGEVAAFEVELEDAEVRAAARTAATVARSADTLDSALTGFVEQMPLPDGVDRAAVLAAAKGFLAGGGK